MKRETTFATFYKWTLGSESCLNLVGKIVLGPIILLVIAEIFILEHLFLKKEEE